LDPSGVAVLSLSATDPGQMVQNMMGGGGEDESRFKMETELSDVKMLLEDGTEVPAEVVLRDRDLDLAFIRPKTKLAAAMPAVDLTSSGKADVLEEVVTLNRLGKAAGRSYSASVERISAIVQRPRLFYVPEANMTTTTLGAPAFTTNGKILGIFVMRTAKGTGSSGFGMIGSPSDTFTGIIVPADDVLKAVKQVPAAAEEKEKEKEKEKE
jgi:S1-C subfamily serine protease